MICRRALKSTQYDLKSTQYDLKTGKLRHIPSTPPSLPHPSSCTSLPVRAFLLPTGNAQPSLNPAGTVLHLYVHNQKHIMMKKELYTCYTMSMQIALLISFFSLLYCVPCVCTCVCVCAVCVCVFVCLCVCVYVLVHMHVCVYVYVCVCMFCLWMGCTLIMVFRVKHSNGRKQSHFA